MSFSPLSLRTREIVLASIVAVFSMLCGVLVATPASAATASLTITPIEWSVVGLDSNNVTAGPNQFSIGAQVCNVTGVPVTAISATWAFTTANANVNLNSAATKTISSLAANTCKKMWWSVLVTRTSAAYDTTRKYTVTASASGVTTVVTPSNREIYVEHLVSQNRNGTRSITGPTNVMVGQTVSYVLSGFTATNGYEQLSAGPILDGSIFDIQSVSATYAVPSGATNTLFYADSCGWNPNVGDVKYKKCVGTGSFPELFTGGKAGGDPIQVTVTARVVGTGTTSILGNIYDYSGSSFHYNSDYGDDVISVTSTNPSPPVAVADSASTYSGVGVLINVPGNDSDPNGDLNLTSVSVTGAAGHGTTNVNAVTGEITYTPSISFVGIDTFTYQICDSQPVCVTALVTVTVTAPPSPPIASDDTSSTLSGVAVLIDVPFNDSDLDGDLDVTSVHVLTLPANGSVSVNPTTGKITYTPGASFVGTATFTYEICDQQSPTPACDSATVTVTVTAPQSPPVAGDDAVNATTAVPVEINVPSNDSDVDGDLDVTSVTVTTAASHGSTSVNATTGKITYTSDSGYTGVDTFEYQICDEQSPIPACDTAVVTVTIFATPPPASPPVANPDSSSTISGVAVSIDVPLNDTDIDGDLDVTSVTVTGAAVHGSTSVDPITGHVTYTPDVSFVGTDTFTYEICDSQPVCDTALVTITVAAPPAPPIADPDNATTDSGVGVLIDVPDNDSDADGDLDVTSVTVTIDPAHGSTSVNGTTGAVTYTPDLSFVGTDSFTYLICDSQPVCDSALVTITVSAPPAPPVANPDSATTTSGVGVVIDVPTNDTDVDGDLDVTSVSIASAPSNGSTSIDALTGEITYTPDLSFVGTDTFTYEICDSQPVCDTALVTIHVAAPPVPPVADPDSASTDSGVAVLIDVPGNDSDADGDLDVTSVSITVDPVHGIVSVNPTTGEVTYTPDASFVGTDTFTYEICDSQPACDTALVTIAVSAPPSPPVANPESATTQSGVAVAIDVPGNDSDVDGDLDDTSVTIWSAPSHGVTSINPATGEVTYTPDVSFAGVDTFIYEICDLQPVCDTALVTITVDALPSPPVADDDAATAQTAVPVLINVPLNDSDPDGDLDVTSVFESTAPLHGSTSVNATTGKITYTSDALFTGVDTFEYTICDLQSPSPACDVALVTVTVSAAPPVPSPPVAGDDGAATESGVAVGIDVPLNDSDVDGDLDETSVSITIDPLNGTASVDPSTGHITYTPDSSFVGTDTVTYEICDLQSPTPACDTAIVTITVTAPTSLPEPPVAENNDVSTDMGKPVTIDVLDNDSDPNGDLDPSSVTVLVGPLHGTFTIDPVTFAIIYTPDPGFTGEDTLTYEVCDSQPVCTSATVTITIAGFTSLASTGDNVQAPLMLSGGAILLGLLAVLFGRRRKRQTRA